MNAIERGAEIERARAERIVGTAYHVARQIRPTPQHLRGRRPGWPFALGAHALHAAPAEALASNADAVAQRLAVAEHEIEAPLAGPDHDRAGLVVVGEADRRARNWSAARVTPKAEEIGDRIVAGDGLVVICWTALRRGIRDSCGG